MNTAGNRAAGPARARRRLRVGLSTLASLALLVTSGCVARPGPAPTVEPEPTTSTSSTSSAVTEPNETTSTTTTTTERSEIAVGVEPLLNGFNPHLLSDNNATVESIASLVLPSVFRDGELDTGVMTSANLVTPTGEDYAQTVRYVINPAAQWSDGTPITGSDFNYLWEAMTRNPAVINAAGYAAIADVRTSAGGKTVDVSFEQPFAEWRELFTHLLPSHMAEPGGADFITAMAASIPASAGRFMVANVDRARGVIRLHRNDRFWGEGPARAEILTLIEVSSPAQGSDLLRSGQVNYLDVVPAETSVEAYDLVPGTETRLVDGPRQLEVSLSTTSPVLSDHQRRRELLGLLNPDVDTIARQAAGRSAHLLPAPALPQVPGVAEPMLASITEERPLRIGADPADEAATAAARTMADLLVGQGVGAEVVSTDLPDLAGEQLPDGEVDAVVSWRHLDDTATSPASTLLCPPRGDAFRPGNLSGFCTPETNVWLKTALSQGTAAEEVAAWVESVANFEHLRLPLLQEQRVAVLGEGIVVPDGELAQWQRGLEAAATWRLATDSAAASTAVEPGADSGDEEGTQP